MDKKYLLSFGWFCLPFCLGLIGLYLFAPIKNLYPFFHSLKTTHPGFSNFVLFLTNWGNFFFYPIYLYFLIKGLKEKKPQLTYLALFYLCFQLLISFLLVRILKISLGRARPEFGSHFTFFSLSSSYHSFPSGHTTEIFGAALPLALKSKKKSKQFLLGVVAFAVGFSRIYLGQHHLTDVMAGFILGNCSGILTFYFWRKKCQQLALSKK